MATTPAEQIERLDNEQLLDLFEVVAADIRRRIRNYGETDEAPALLDGIKLAARGQRIASDLMHGHRTPSGARWGLHRAQHTLTELLAGERVYYDPLSEAEDLLHEDDDDPAA